MPICADSFDDLAWRMINAEVLAPLTKVTTAGHSGSFYRSSIRGTTTNLKRPATSANSNKNLNRANVNRQLRSLQRNGKIFHNLNGAKYLTTIVSYISLTRQSTGVLGSARFWQTKKLLLRVEAISATIPYSSATCVSGLCESPHTPIDCSMTLIALTGQSR